jgi:hypothetical protein
MNCKILFYAMIFLVSYSCKSKEKNEPITPPSAIPADFEVFYERFGKDSVFQMQRIVFPLEGRPALTDAKDTIPANFKWLKEDWVIHRTYDDMGGTFSRSFLNFSGIITEEIEGGSGQYTMIRRFAKLSNGRHLIYDKEMGK